LVTVAAIGDQERKEGRRKAAQVGAVVAAVAFSLLFSYTLPLPFSPATLPFFELFRRVSDKRRERVRNREKLPPKI